MPVYKSLSLLRVNTSPMLLADHVVNNTGWVVYYADGIASAERFRFNASLRFVRAANEQAERFRLRLVMHNDARQVRAELLIQIEQQAYGVLVLTS